MFRDNVSVTFTRVKKSKKKNNPLPTFRDNVSVPFSRFKNSNKKQSFTGVSGQRIGHIYMGQEV
jgi:hypothetical protein